MRQIVVELVALSGLAFWVVCSFAVGCSQYDSNMGATFDLTDLIRTPSQPAYIVEDGDLPCTSKVEQNYTYVFNICGAVSGGLPRSCDFVENIEKAGAVQLDQRGTDSTQDDYCYLVGQFNDASTKLELLNQEDPTEGLQLTYYGAYCRGLISSVQRQFNIQLTCANRLSPVPTQALELKPCIYTIQMPSIYGCPLECPVSNRQLCGGQGHCAFDPDKHAARCFCNNGYTSSDCTKPVDTNTTLNYSPALLGLIITLFIIVLVLGISILYMARQLTAYKEDMANYQSLQASSSHGMHDGATSAEV